jgi:hypothetical protein
MAVGHGFRLTAQAELDGTAETAALIIIRIAHGFSPFERRKTV